MENSEHLLKDDAYVKQAFLCRIAPAFPLFCFFLSFLTYQVPQASSCFLVVLKPCLFHHPNTGFRYTPLHLTFRNRWLREEERFMNKHKYLSSHSKPNQTKPKPNEHAGLTGSPVLGQGGTRGLPKLAASQPICKIGSSRRSDRGRHSKLAFVSVHPHPCV